jgi:enolase
MFRYLSRPTGHVVLVPIMNGLNGRAHADSGMDIQEFMAYRRRELSRGAALGERRSTTA